MVGVWMVGLWMLSTGGGWTRTIASPMKIFLRPKGAKKFFFTLDKGGPSCYNAVMKTNESAPICPSCGESYTDYPALSRRDNKTNICSACGGLEAMEDYTGNYRKDAFYWDFDCLQGRWSLFKLAGYSDEEAYKLAKDGAPVEGEVAPGYVPSIKGIDPEIFLADGRLGK